MTRGCASGAQRYTAPFGRIRVKAGATAPFVDSTFGKLWAADFGYLGGSIYTGRATLDPMIQTERTATGTLEYRFNVTNEGFGNRIRSHPDNTSSKRCKFWSGGGASWLHLADARILERLHSAR